LFRHTSVLKGYSDLPEGKKETLAATPSVRKPVAKRKAPGSGGLTGAVTLRVGTEFEGKTDLFIHEAHTLSTL
jgi:hypothetical protein